MYVGNVSNVPQQDVSSLLKGTRGFYVQWLVTRDNGSFKYAVRRFVVKPNGYMPLHNHKYTEAAEFICVISYEDDMTLKPLE
jgi:quercetin dioxygenase-like cupin family protein